ncbi:MAG: cellulase family glycosylhydrolase [Planctomycetota bacterium]|nr:cellulase family glycosylhydrolase [Planctomycetota bacterium]
MYRWDTGRAAAWYERLPWLVGCNFLPSSAVNQLEMWQAETWDPATIERELGWAGSLGFNVLRVFLHDLLWTRDGEGFLKRVDDFLGIADRHGMRVIFVFFDDCHRPSPKPGRQPPPVPGVHNSGWVQSPGREVVERFHDGTVPEEERRRLADYVRGVLIRFGGDRRILMWDIYNEPGQTGAGNDSFELLSETWRWAREAAPAQPLTSCLEGSVGEKNAALNRENSDVVTFHCYSGPKLEETILRHKETFGRRPLICTEYMARELGTTFRHSLPVFRKHRVGCLNWGLVAGRSQTHFNWKTVEKLEGLKASGAALKPGDPIPEPELWFHDIFRVDGTPFDGEEVEFVRGFVKEGRQLLPPGRGNTYWRNPAGVF